MFVYTSELKFSNRCMISTLWRCQFEEIRNFILILDLYDRKTTSKTDIKANFYSNSKIKQLGTVKK